MGGRIDDMAHKNRVRFLRATSDQLKASILIEMGRWLAGVRFSSIDIIFIPETDEVEIVPDENSPIDFKMTNKKLSQLMVKVEYADGNSIDWTFPGHILEHSYADCATVIVDKMKQRKPDWIV